MLLKRGVNLPNPAPTPRRMRSPPLLPSNTHPPRATNDTPLHPRGSAPRLNQPLPVEQPLKQLPPIPTLKSYLPPPAPSIPITRLPGHPKPTLNPNDSSKENERALDEYPPPSVRVSVAAFTSLISAPKTATELPETNSIYCGGTLI
jgi:hypothetical protein